MVIPVKDLLALEKKNAATTLVLFYQAQRPETSMMARGLVTVELGRGGGCERRWRFHLPGAAAKTRAEPPPQH